MKKVGKILLSVLPLLVYIVLQFAGIIVGSIAAGVMVGVEAAAQGYINDAALIAQRSQEVYMELSSVIIVGIHICGVIVGAIWVYFLFGKKKPVNPVKSFSWITLPIIALCAVGIQYTCSYALTIVNIVKPEWMANYNAMVEAAGFTELGFMTILATIILAPIGEEILFRGVTLRLAKNAGLKFWIANTIQAVFFGIAHLNVVQGIYAFAMGLILGYIYEKYNSLYVSILLHALINFLGTVVSVLLSSNVPETAVEPGLGICIVGFVGFALMLTAGLLLMKKDRKVCHPAEIKGEDEYAAI